MHYRQLIRSGKFEKFDFGFEENAKRYGQTEPPEYDLSKIKGVKLALFCGKTDLLSSPKDYTWCRDQLVNAEVVFFKEYDAGHAYFLFPAHPRPHFRDMAELIKKHNPKI